MIAICRAAKVFDAPLHDPAQLVRIVLGLLALLLRIRRNREQEVQIFVAHLQAAAERADADLRNEVALQAFECRAQQAVHERPGTRLARFDATGHAQQRDELARFLTEAKEIDGSSIIEQAEQTLLGARRRMACFGNQRGQVGADHT